MTPALLSLILIYACTHTSSTTDWAKASLVALSVTSNILLVGIIDLLDVMNPYCV